MSIRLPDKATLHPKAYSKRFGGPVATGLGQPAGQRPFPAGRPLEDIILSGPGDHRS